MKVIIRKQCAKGSKLYKVIQRDSCPNKTVFTGSKEECLAWVENTEGVTWQNKKNSNS